MIKYLRILQLFILFLLFSCALPVDHQKDLKNLPAEERALAQVEFGLAAFSANKFFEAESFLRKAHAYAPRVRNIRYNLALTLIRNEQPIEAEEILKTLIVESNQSLYQATLADLYIRDFKYVEALKIYLSLLGTAELTKDQKSTARYTRNVSQILFILGEEEDALCYSERALELGGVDEETAHTAMLSALNLSQRIVDNKEILNRARQRRDAVLITWYVLANYDLGKYAEAYFLTKILEAEALSGGVQFGVLSLIELVNSKHSYIEGSDKTSEAKVSPNKLMRNYWPFSVLSEFQRND